MYFVMLNHPDVNVAAVPLLKADAKDAGDIAFFESEEDAFSAAESNDLGENFGYDVFALGNGL